MRGYFGVSTVCLKSAEGAALGAAIQGAYAAQAALGKPVTFRELCARVVQVDNHTRCVPNEEHEEMYTSLLARQSEITRRLHAGGLL